jgi:ABC-type molybdate transport system permease subunit
LAFLEYHRILNVDWYKVQARASKQAISQNGIDWVADALTHVSSTIGASHPDILSNIGIPLVSSVSAGFVLGLARG